MVKFIYFFGAIIVIYFSMFAGYEIAISKIKPTVPITLHDTIYPIVKVGEKDTDRYFMIAYETKLKNDDRKITGTMWIDCNGFPNKTDIDSMVYADLWHKKECYQNVIILSIYEFKNAMDYYSFGVGVKQAKIYKNKKECCDVSPTKFYISDSSFLIPPNLLLDSINLYRDSIFMQIDSILLKHKQFDSTIEQINAKNNP